MVERYTAALELLDAYGHQRVGKPKGCRSRARLGYDVCRRFIGGMRFGSDAADSVLDPNCRAWQFDNLYVTDGAFMPTSGGANPTLTIQANALRVADQLLARL